MLSPDSHHNLLVGGVVPRLLEFMEQGIFFIGTFSNANKDLSFEWNEALRKSRCVVQIFLILSQTRKNIIKAWHERFLNF